MGGLKDLVNIEESEERMVSRTLQRLESNKMPIRVEVEEANVHFYSVFSIRRNMIVMAKPPGLQKELKRNGFVRFAVPEMEGKEIRLPIAVPHFNMLNDNFVFLCDIPDKFAEPSRRANDRFNTSRFNNLLLVIPSSTRQFRIIDISMEGCKILSSAGDGEQDYVFPIGETLNLAKITVGSKVEIDLNAVIPRSQHGKTAGIQFQLDGATDSGKVLERFIRSLEQSEQARMTAPAN